MKRGDRVLMIADVGRSLMGLPSTTGIVTRVARDGSWVDVRWTHRNVNGVVHWSKRQRDPAQLLVETTTGVAA